MNKEQKRKLREWQSFHDLADALKIPIGYLQAIWKKVNKDNRYTNV